MVKICFTAHGRLLFLRDRTLTVSQDSGRFYGTLHLGTTSDAAGELMMTVERI